MSNSHILFKLSNTNSKENYPIYNHEMLKLPIFKEDNDDKLCSNQNNLIDESYSSKITSFLKSNEITTKETNNQEIKNNLDIWEKKAGDIKANSFAIKIPKEEGKEQKEDKKCGRKRGGSKTKGQHSKYSDDNLRRKIKHLSLSIIKDFINDKIKEIYHGNIGQGMAIKKLLCIKHQQKSNINVEYNKEFLNKTLGEIFSDDLSSKFTNYPKEHNRNLIKALTNEEDESKRTYFNRLFNLTFLDGLEHFRGSQIHKELIGLEGYHKVLENLFLIKNLLSQFCYNLKLAILN